MNIAEIKKAFEEKLWVKYKPTAEIGKIKSIINGYAFVVYNSNNDWANYTNYTAQKTDIDYLKITNKNNE